MARTWVEYKQGSAVQEANVLVANLLQSGWAADEITKMHQGAEETELSGALEGMKTYEGRLRSAYNKTKGGFMAHRENAADFASGVLGFTTANASNTFLFPVNARAMLSVAFHYASEPYMERFLRGEADMRPAAVIPGLCWPMVKDEAYERYVRTLVPYDMHRGMLDSDILKAFAAHQEGRENPASPYYQTTICAPYTCLPNNPLGLAGTTKEMHSLQGSLTTRNTERAQHGLPRITHIIDTPYYAGAPHKTTGAALETAYESVLRKGDDAIAVIGFAKALAAAEGACAMHFSNPDTAALFEQRIAAGIGFSYEPNKLENISKILSPENRSYLLEHFKFLHQKYKRNFAFVQDKLGALLLDADPNMVCTFEVPVDALNKLVTCVDGVKREIRSGREVAEFIANTHGVITVDQSLGERQLIRLALKAENSAEVERGAEKIEQSLEMLRNAPGLAA